MTNRKGTQDAEGHAASSLYSLECELCEAINRRLIAGVKTKVLYSSVALWETGSRPKKPRVHMQICWNLDLKLEDGAVVHLVCVSGQIVEIHLLGSHTVNNICAQIRAEINLLRRRQ